MTASWLAQMGWETYVLEGGYDGTLEIGPPHVIPKPDPSHRYRRPYEGTDIKESAMQAYLDWEYGLVEQLRRDARMDSSSFDGGRSRRIGGATCRAVARRAKAEGGIDTHHSSPPIMLSSFSAA